MLERERNLQVENKLKFNVTYYPAFQNTKILSEELQILLPSDEEHQNVCPNIPIVGFHHGKSLKDLLIRASLLILNNTSGSEPCGRRNGYVFELIVNTNSFRLITTEETFQINKHPLN